MRGIYLKYSNSADKTLEKIKLQIQKLNGLVVQYSLSKIYSNYDMYKHYLMILVDYHYQWIYQKKVLQKIIHMI